MGGGGKLATMTVIALGRGPTGTFNLLLADTRVPTTRGVCERQKVVPIGESEFITVLGEELVRDAASLLAFLVSPDELDLRQKDTVVACFAGGALSRRIHRINCVELMPISGTAVVVCNRAAAYYWHAKFYRGQQTFAEAIGPTDIPLGKLAILYGGHPPKYFEMAADKSRPFAQALECIREVDAEHRKTRTAFAYELPDRFGGVMVPQDPSRPYRWEHPFDSLAELLAKQGPLVRPLEARDYVPSPRPRVRPSRP